MKVRLLFTFLLFLLLSLPVFSVYHRGGHSRGILSQNQLDQVSPRVILPVYIRLQALEKGNVTLWESIPQNFTDHVAAIDSSIVAMFVSSNSVGFNLSKDSVGNLWMAANYSLKAGDYFGTMAWVTSETVSENLTSIGYVPFTQNYAEDVKHFLESGRKIDAGNETIQTLAANLNQAQNNMTQTVKNILDYVNMQGYDRNKTRQLLSGNLNATDMLDVFKDALEVHDTNSSICLERSWYAAAILRAVGVPTRTVTDVRLKTWIQVWFPNVGWVDGETLCVEPALHVVTLPKSVSAHVPWMIENSSDAAFPFTWLPEVPLRVANLTFAQVEFFDVSQYQTVLSRPVKAELFKNDPAKFRFPIGVKSEVIYGAVTEEESNLVFSVFKGKENVSEVLALGEYNSIVLSDTAVSFKPTLHEGFLVLQGFTVQDVWMFDYRILFPIVGVPVVLLVIWLFIRRSRHGS